MADRSRSPVNVDASGHRTAPTRMVLSLDLHTRTGAFNSASVGCEYAPCWRAATHSVKLFGTVHGRMELP